MLSEYLKSRREIECFGKAKPEEKKVYRIPKQSKKRKSEDKVYLKKKKEYLTAHIRCEVEGCNRVSESLHHKKGRVGKNLYDERFFMAVCNEHHRKIEDFPDWAIENGYSLKRLNVEA